MKKFLFLALFIAPVVSMAQVTYQRTPKGVQYHVVTANAGAKIKLDDVITFNITEKTEKDSVLFSSYTNGHAVQIQVKPSANIGDLMDIFPLLANKDSAIVRVPTDSIFAGHEESRPPFLPKGSSIVFNIKVERVQPLAEAIAERNAAMAEQKAAIDKMKGGEAATADKYIADHKLVLKSTASGLKYNITHATTKRRVMAGDTIEVAYAGRTTDDKVFDTSIESVAKEAGTYQPGNPYQPISFVVGEAHVIAGWDEGLQLLNEGSKATFVIPSNLGYADQGNGPIPPFATLIFDVEIVKVTPGKVKPKTVAKTGTAKKPATTAAKTPVKKPGAAPAKKPAAPVKK
jgi:FKBP-type peptidyl-prolyl cis-trans isomerase FkpA